MNILILETGAIETLTVTDPRTDVDYIADFIGNADGIGADENDIDGKFVKIENLSESYTAEGYDIDFSQYDADDYVTSQGNFEWWSVVVAAEQEVQELIQKARGMGIDSDDINDALDQPQSDLDNLIYAQIQEISELIDLAK